MNLELMHEQVVYFRDRLLKRQNQALKTNTWLNIIQKLQQLETIPESTSEYVTKAYDAFVYYIAKEPTDRKVRRKYLTAYDEMIKHFKKTYKYTVKGTYLTLFMGVGIVVGAAVGLIISTVETTQYAMTIALGMLAGIVVGNQIENRLNKEDKLI